MKRTGCIYSEFTNSGRRSMRFARGSNKPVYSSRWVGEIEIGCKRYRFRSTNLKNVEAWVQRMVKFGEFYDEMARGDLTQDGNGV